MKHQETSLSVRAQALRSRWMLALRAAREALSLTQAEVGRELGVSRVTVHRVESEAADPQLSTFLGLALACGLSPSLEGTGEEGCADPRTLKHRGLAHVRTQHEPSWRDRQRERALAKAWEAANKYQPVGLQPIIPSLIPGCTQEQATACATVVQWLGSEVGFDFLKQALSQAGYEVVDRGQRGGAMSA